MGKFTREETAIAGVCVITPKMFGDERGYFMETYNVADFRELGLTNDFVQDNQSKSRKGVLRGLHFQKTCPQAKLVRVIHGEVFDVAVDLREGSPTYGKYVGITLSEKNKKMFYIPRGFAHGFLVLSDEAEFCYKVDNLYAPESEAGLMWNDPEIKIKWPKIESELILSEKDQKHPSLKQSGHFSADGEKFLEKE